MANAISNLHFDSDIPVTVVLTGSPFKKKPRSQPKFKVFFSVSGRDTLQAVERPWTSMQLFCAGQQFMNGSFIGFDRKEEEKTLFVSDISDIQEDLVREHLDSFGFKLPKEETQLNEECITFSAKGLTFVVPCMQIIRTFYAPHPFLNKQITTNEDLCSLIESEKNLYGKLIIKFKDWLPAITKPLVESFILIQYIPALRDSWKKIVSDYKVYGIFKAFFPIIPKLRITCKGYLKDNKFYVNRIIWCNEPELPFSKVEFFPEKDKIKKNPLEKDKRGNTEKGVKSDNLIVDEPGVSPGKRSPNKRIQAQATHEFSLSKKIKRSGNVTILDKSLSSFSEEGVDIVSTKSPTERGIAKKLDIDTSKIAIDIQSDESFIDFCKALIELQNIMNVEIIDIFTGEYPGDFSYCMNDSGRIRKYKVADIKLKNYYYHWLVIDVENTNHSTASMLIIRKNEDAKSQASKMINRLVYTGKGHWTSSCFDEIEGLGLPYNTLKHYKERSAYKWAIWIKKKINELQHEVKL